MIRAQELGRGGSPAGHTGLPAAPSDPAPRPPQSSLSRRQQLQQRQLLASSAGLGLLPPPSASRARRRKPDSSLQQYFLGARNQSRKLTETRLLSRASKPRNQGSEYRSFGDSARNRTAPFGTDSVSPLALRENPGESVAL